MRSLRARLLSMLVLSTTVGCTRTPPPASPAEKAPAQVAPSDSAKAEADARAKSGEITDPKDAMVPVSEDRSLDYVVYAAGGMPALTSAWSPADYMSAAKTLNNLAGQNRLFLPREKSPRSGAIFERMLSHENFEGLTPKSSTDYLHSLPLLLGPYTPQKDNIGFPREQARLVALMLWVYPRALAVLANDMGNPDSEKALDEQRIIAVAVVRGAAQMVQEKERYRASDRRLVEEALATEGLALQAHLTPEQGAEITPFLQRR